MARKEAEVRDCHKRAQGSQRGAGAGPLSKAQSLRSKVRGPRSILLRQLPSSKALWQSGKRYGGREVQGRGVANGGAETLGQVGRVFPVSGLRDRLRHYQK